jgi:hypothetical protein
MQRAMMAYAAESAHSHRQKRFWKRVGLAARFSENPLVWILLGLLIISVWSHYNTGTDLRRVCEDFTAFMQEPPFRKDAIPELRKAEIWEIERLCSSHDY